MASANFTDKSIPGGIVYNPATSYAREMAKWEMGYSPYGQPGRPREQVGFHEWPAMFYKMKRKAQNGDFIVEHYQEAPDEVRAAQLESLGYRKGQVAAIEYVKSLENEIAVAAAERAYRDRNMGEKAKAEAEAAEAGTVEHMAEVPVTPIKRRPGRPPKSVIAE
jgi:hypothetical protein